MARGIVRRLTVAAVLGGLLSAPGVAFAGEADVLAVEAACQPAPGGRPASICSFTVTVRHADSGWDHYANRWDVVLSDGEVLASRVLRHPHVEEQPFTRSLGRVRVPHSAKSVVVRANDSVHGGGGAEVTFVVPHAGAGAGTGDADAEPAASPPDPR